MALHLSDSNMLSQWILINSCGHSLDGFEKNFTCSHAFTALFVYKMSYYDLYLTFCLDLHCGRLISLHPICHGTEVVPRAAISDITNIKEKGIA